MWKDCSHIRQGHSGIDVFIGQDLGPTQLDRIIACIANEGLLSAPPWVRMLAWFLEYGCVSDYALDGDFGLDQQLDSVFPHHAVGGFPFKLSQDKQGLNLLQRMQLRMSTRVSFDKYVAKADWFDDAGAYASSTTMFWGECSRQYLTVIKSQQYINLDVCEWGWWFMVPVDSQHSPFVSGGWASPVYFEFVPSQVTMYEVDTSILSQQSAVYDASLSTVHHRTHHRIPLSLGGLGSCAVYSDGACDDRVGIAAGWTFQGEYLSSRA
jgi:hypothetical protein